MWENWRLGFGFMARPFSGKFRLDLKLIPKLDLRLIPKLPKTSF